MKPADVMLLVLVAVLWGLNFVVIRIGIDHFPPIFFSALRFLVASVPLCFFVPRPKISWWFIIGIGLMLCVIKFSLLFIAMDAGLPPGLSSVVLQSQAVFTIVLAIMFLGERSRPVQLLGMLIAATGLVLIATTVAEPSTAMGLALAVGAGLAWACSNIMMKKAGPADMFAIIVWASLIAPVPLLLLSLSLEGWDRDIEALSRLDTAGTGALLFVAYVATVFGFSVWGTMIKRYGAASIAPFSLIAPVAGATSSFLLLGETFGFVRLAAIALIIIGLALIVTQPSLRRPFWSRHN